MSTPTVPSPPSHAARSVRAWRWVALALALSQLAAPAVSKAIAGDFLAAGATNRAASTPAGYAFGLWGVITILSALTVAAVVRYGLGAWWESGVLVDACIVFIGFSTWLIIAAQDWLWTSVFVFAVMVNALVHIMRKLVRHRADLTCPRWVAVLATVSFGLYLGWSSIAVFANITAALINNGWDADGVMFQSAILVAATASAVVLTLMLRGTPGYVAGVLWALVAITVGAAGRGSPVLAGVAAIGATVVAVVAMVALVARRSSRVSSRAAVDGPGQAPDAPPSNAARPASPGGVPGR